MLVELLSDGIDVKIDSMGAELHSVQDIFATEYLWQGDKKYWGRRSPVLFPIIGKQIGDTFTYKGQHYAISRHGFARDSEFEVFSKSKDSVSFSLSYNEETLKVYPFEFKLMVNYAVEGPCLNIEYRVFNLGDNEMYYTIGGHTGFNCPLVADESFDDYCIEFDKPETNNRLLLNKTGLYSGEENPLLKDEKIINLAHPLFAADAIVPDKLNSKGVELKSRKSGKGVRVEFEDFENLAIWSPANDAPFVCLEPWTGYASNVDDSPELTAKKSIVRLESGSFHRYLYKISLI